MRRAAAAVSLPDCLTANVEMNSSQGQLIHGSEEEEEEETDLMFSFPAKLYCSQQLKETKKREIFKVTCYLLLLLPSIRAEARENPPYMAAAAVCVMPRRTPRCMT